MPKGIGYSDALSDKNSGLKSLGKEFYATIFGEVGGGSPEEVAAVASVFLNRARKQGTKKALKGSAAFLRKSSEYKKAFSGNLNAFEQKVFDRNRTIVDKLMQNPQLVMPYTHFENVNAFGEPSWASSMKEFKDIGRQRFYRE